MKQSDHTVHHPCCDSAGETCVVFVRDEHRNNSKETGQIYIYLFELLFFLVPQHSTGWVPKPHGLDLKMSYFSSDVAISLYL